MFDKKTFFLFGCKIVAKESKQMAAPWMDAPWMAAPLMAAS